MSMSIIYVISHAVVALTAGADAEALAAAATPRAVRLISASAFFFAIGGTASATSILVPANSEICIALPAGVAIRAIGSGTQNLGVMVFSPSS